MLWVMMTKPGSTMLPDLNQTAKAGVRMPWFLGYVDGYDCLAYSSESNAEPTAGVVREYYWLEWDEYGEPASEPHQIGCALLLTRWIM
jgi:hypothetical protein